MAKDMAHNFLHPLVCTVVLLVNLGYTP